MDGWQSLAGRAIDSAQVLVWNHVIHSWIDPIFMAGCIAVPLYFCGRWLFKKVG